MKDDELNKILQMNQAPVIQADRKHQTMKMIMTAASQTKTTTRISFLTQFRTQAESVSRVFWGIQLVCFVAIFYLLIYHCWNEILFRNISFLTPFFTVLIFTETFKSRNYGMWELEEACRFNLRQIIWMRTLILVTTDYLLLFIILFAARQSGVSFADYMIYLVIPFQLENIVFLMILKHLRGFRVSSYLLIAIAVLLSMGQIACSILISRYAQMLPSMQAGILALAVGIITLIIMIQNQITLTNQIKENLI